MIDRRSYRAAALLLATLFCLLLSPLSALAGTPLPPIRPIRTTGLPADIAAILLSGQEGGDLPIAVLATPTADGSGGVTVPLSIEIDAGVLFDFIASAPATDSASEAAMADEPPEPERLEIYAYVLGADGTSIQDSLLQAYDIDAERLDEGRRGLRYVAELRMPRPPGLVRLLVRLQQRDALAVHSIEIGDMAPGGIHLTAPLVEGSGDWIRLPWILPTGQLPPPPKIFADRAPASRAVIVRGEPLKFQLLADGLDAVGSGLTLELAAADGRLSGQATGEITGYSAPDERRQRRLDATADSTNLPLGAFDLSAILPAGGSGLRSPSLPVLVIDAQHARAPDAGAGAPDAWPWLIARLTAPDAPRLVDNGPKVAVDHLALQQALGEILGYLAAGQDTDARRRHVQLATAIADESGSLGLKALGKAEYLRAKLLAGLGGEEEEAAPAQARKEYADAVLPLAALNFELYRETRRLGLTLVSTHARFMTLRLMELYLRASANHPSAQNTAATLLVSLGGELQLADMVYFSERMFRKALEMDSDQPTALLALGMNYQLIGDVGRAKDAFENLVAQNPGHGEANLRLARLELIEGRRRGARRLLEKAATSDAPSWVRSVAFQELARLDIDDADLDEAQAWLEKAIAQLPEEPRLQILLAFVHNAARRTGDAKSALAHTAASHWPDRPSARRRFGSWSRESFVLNDRQLQQHIDGARQVLRARWSDVEQAAAGGSAP